MNEFTSKLLGSSAPIGEILLAETAIRIELPPSLHGLAVDRYETIRKYIERDGSPLAGRVRIFYPQLLDQTPLHAEARQIGRRVFEFSEFLTKVAKVTDVGAVFPHKVTYHDACHLCHAQQIRKQPRQLLELIPDLQLVPLNESEICCGAAGSYNLTQPEMAERLGDRKIKNIVETQAEAVFTGNVGCLLQIGRHLRHHGPGLWVAHPIDALWASYSGILPRRTKT